MLCFQSQLFLEVYFLLLGKLILFVKKKLHLIPDLNWESIIKVTRNVVWSNSSNLCVSYNYRKVIDKIITTNSSVDVAACRINKRETCITTLIIQQIFNKLKEAILARKVSWQSNQSLSLTKERSQPPMEKWDWVRPTIIGLWTRMWTELLETKEELITGDAEVLVGETVKREQSYGAVRKKY